MAIYNLFTPSLDRVTDDNGNIVVGAKMYVFLSENQSPAPFYLDTNGTVQGSHPLISNSSGLFEERVYLNPNIIYKIRLEDANGNEIWTIDKLYGFDVAASQEEPSVDETVLGLVNDALATVVDAADEVALAAEEVAESTELARLYAVSQLDEEIPGAVETSDRGARYWSFEALAAKDGAEAAITAAIGTAAADAADDAAALIVADMETYKEDAINAANEAAANAAALNYANLGVADYQPTRAAAEAAIGTYSVGDVIQIAADEDTESGGPSLVRVVAGPALELFRSVDTYKATYAPNTRQRSIVERLSSEIYFEDVLTAEERAEVWAGTPTFDAGARLEQLINDTSGYATVTNFSAGRVIRLPAGKLRFMTTCNVKHTVKIIGEGRNDNANIGNTIISCDQGVEGFVFNSHDTYGSGLDDGSYGGTTSIESWLEDVLIRSEETWDETVSTRLGVVNGIRVRAKFNGFNIHVHNFPGAGIHQYNAASTSFADRRGNGNYSTYDKIKFTSNLIGWYVDGGDANVIRVGSMDCRSNKMWGILTGCLLGNHIGTVHTAYNGNSEYSAAWHKYARWLFRGGTMGPLGMLGTINAVGSNSEPGILPVHWQMDLPDDSAFPGTWNAGATYPDNNQWLKHNSRRWKSKSAVPVGTEPGTDGGVYWEDFGELDAALGYTAYVRYQPNFPGIGAKRTYLGIRWTAVSSSAGSMIPGQDNPQWEFRGFQTRANVFFPVWDSGRTYYQGGAYGNNEANAPNKIEHLYVEADQRIVTGSKDHIAGGIYSLGGTGIAQAGFLQQGKGWISQMEATHPAGIGTLTFNSASSNRWLAINYLHDDAQGIDIRQETASNALRVMQGGSREIFRITQKGNTDTFGRSVAPGAGYIAFGPRVMLGNTTTTSRQIDINSAAPSGDRGQGDITFNRSSPVAGIWGWQVTTGGASSVATPRYTTADPGRMGAETKSASFTATPFTAKKYQRYTAVLSVNRQATFSKTGAVEGLTYRLIREASATGVGVLEVKNGVGGPTIATLDTPGTYVDIVYDGVDYFNAGKGTL